MRDPHMKHYVYNITLKKSVFIVLLHIVFIFHKIKNRKISRDASNVREDVFDMEMVRILP